MSRTKTVVKNTLWELGYYLIVIAFGFLAPRYIILIYGSEVNGLSSTITQILNVILVLQSGTTTAAIFALYRPIAENDVKEISRNIYAAERFFKKLSFLFCGIMVVVAVFTAILIKSNIQPRFIFLAFVIMGMKSFLDLYFTSKFRIVFTAFQEKFVISIATLIEQVVYYLLVFLTLYLHTHFIFIYLWLFVGCVVKVFYLDKKYKKEFGSIILSREGTEDGQIVGRGYAFANEVAHSVVSSSIAIILSFMYGLQETSVYSVYALVGQALSLVATSLYSAFAPSFGCLVAEDNKEDSKRIFEIFQFIFVMFNSIMYCCMTALIVPFVEIYTSGASDINYANRMLACIMGLSGIFSTYRIPYNIIVSSCGYFKETWIQPVVSVLVSFLFSYLGGKYNYSLILIGPAFFYLINFVYQHFRLKKLVPYLISEKVFVMFGVSILGFALSALVCFYQSKTFGILLWLVFAVVYVFISIIFFVSLSYVLLPIETKNSCKYIKAHLFRRQRNA